MKKSPSAAGEVNTPSSDEKTSGKDAVVLVLSLLVAIGLSWSVLVWMQGMWKSSPDYSHGYFVPIFSAYLLWSNRKQLLAAVSDKDDAWRGLWIGCVCLLAAAALRAAGILTNIYTLGGLSLIPLLLGIIGILRGWRALLVASPAILFLAFMIPLPRFLAGRMSGALQFIATDISTFSLQTLGVPAISTGNIISLSNGEIGVAEACSGLRMLFAFFALTVGTCMVIDRTWVEKAIISLCAVPIAIAANCIRITATGLAYEFSTPEFAEEIFHDWAGWLMMPLGFGLLVIVLAIMDRLLVPTDDWQKRPARA